MLSQLSYSPSEVAQAIQQEWDCQRSGAHATLHCRMRKSVELETPAGVLFSAPFAGPQKAPAFGSCGFESHLRHRTRGVASTRRIPERRAPSEITDNRECPYGTGV